jgi:hypothetical protein
MIKAIATMDDGRYVLLIGLSDENLARLRADQTLAFEVAEFRLEKSAVIGSVVMFSRTTEEACMEALTDFIGPETQVEARPRGSRTPQ